ncbi:MAG: helix-turn-helix domain-containing protein [Pseudomonadota bacterium]|nr:helix-turn-helix domain-containing protein [Pseudomonadota bacterium]
MQRYIDAGRKAAARGVPPGAIESCANEWAATTFHPVWAHMLGMNDPFEVIDCVNDYNGRLDVPSGDDVESIKPHFGASCWELSSESKSKFRLRARRLSEPGAEDPWPCQLASFGCIRFAVESAEHRSHQKIHATRTLSGAAAIIGVERTPVAEACSVLEQEGAISVERIAAHLGCTKRTLERSAQAVGLTVGRVRLATMMVEATNRLGSGDSLTTIAMDSGFADLAHMSNAFKVACGMSPSAIRRKGRSVDGSRATRSANNLMLVQA